MFVEVALPDVDDDDLPPFATARIAEPRCCPVLGRPLQEAVSRLIAGMTVVLVHRESTGDVRLYGDGALSAALSGLDLEKQCWVVFDTDHDDRGESTERDLAA